MKKSLRVPGYLEHIAEAIARISTYTDGMDWERFASDTLTQDATIRNLEIIGEASRNILRADPDFLVRHPEFPLVEAIGMRNTLSHGYMEVKLDIVWKTVQENLPGLAEKVAGLLPKLRGPDPQPREAP